MMKRWIVIGMIALLAMGAALAEPTATESADAALNTEAEASASTVPDNTLKSDPTASPKPMVTLEATATPSAGDALLDAALPDPEDIAALADDAGTGEAQTVWFEEGYGLTLPAGWVSYPVSDEDRSGGVRYALGDGSGEDYLYIQSTPTQLQSVTAIEDAVDREDGLTKTGNLTFGGVDFVAFIDSAQNASCCMTLWGDRLVAFVFTPQSNADFMLTATQIMETFVIA